MHGIKLVSARVQSQQKKKTHTKKKNLYIKDRASWLVGTNKYNVTQPHNVQDRDRLKPEASLKCNQRRLLL